MFDESLNPTKVNLYIAAAKLFADRGYDNVGMRDLANAVGIKVQSIYSHFKTKSEIRYGLFEAYTKQQYKIMPDIDDILKAAETEPPVEALMLLHYHYPEDIAPIMSQILAIGAMGISTDPDCWRFVEENTILTSKRVIQVIERLIELGRIEPFDVKAFSTIFLHYKVSSTVLHATPMKFNTDDWYGGIRFLYDAFIKPIG